MIALILACTPPAATGLDTSDARPGVPTEAEIALIDPIALTTSANDPPLELLLFPLSDGGLAVSTRNRRPLDVAALDRERRRDRIVIDPGEMGTLDAIQWDLFEVDLRDTDGDGVADEAGGYFAGWVFNPEGYFENYDGPLTGVLDEESGGAWVSGPRREHPTLPTDVLRVELDEPVIRPGGLRFEVAGAVVGSPAPDTWRTDVVVEFDHQEGPWPFGATIDLAGPTIFDTSGNPVTPEALEIVDDPGPLTINPGFEGYGGWAMSHAQRVEEVGSLRPFSGKTMLEVEQDGAALGYLLVPEDAEHLSLALAYLAQLDDPWVQTRSKVIVVEQDGSRRLVWTANERPGEVCLTCPALPYVVDWHTLEIDLVPYRGQRLMLLVEVETDVPFPLRNRILVDAVEVSLEAR